MLLTESSRSFSPYPGGLSNSGITRPDVSSGAVKSTDHECLALGAIAASGSGDAESHAKRKAGGELWLRPRRPGPVIPPPKQAHPRNRE